MLTNLFYYDYYKPYILKTEGRSAAASSRAFRDSYMGKGTAKTASARHTVSDSGKSYVLNAARKNEIISFMRDLSQNMTSLREEAKSLEDAVRRYPSAGRHDTTEKTRLADQLRGFAATYNDTYAFARESTHSAALRRFAGVIGDSAQSAAGSPEPTSFFRLDSQNKMFFDEQRFETTDADALRTALPRVLAAAETIKDDTAAFLLEPLAKHLSFQNLEYYYSYQYGRMDANAFRIIEHGLLLDLVI